MSSNSDFFSHYRSPEWQKKRLEIMESAGFECRECQSKDKTLNVHHRYYIKGAKPWEYSNSALVCLCEDCHKYIQSYLNSIKMRCGHIPKESLKAALTKIVVSVCSDPESDFGDGFIPIKGLCAYVIAEHFGLKCFACFDSDELEALADENGLLYVPDIARFVAAKNLTCPGYETHKKNNSPAEVLS